jgi:uncharacterized membrane protein
MVLPLVASVFGVIYLFTRAKEMSKIFTGATLVAAIAMIVVWYTGSQAGPEIYDYLSAQGQDALIEHKTLGLYLAITMGVIALLQLVGSMTKKFPIEGVAVVLLLAATATTFVQGNRGGELVYNYGMPFKAYMIQDTLETSSADAKESDDADEKVEIYEDAIWDIASISEEVDKILGNPPKQETTTEEESE